LSILLADLLAAYQNLAHGRPVVLPKATSFKHWAERLGEYARTPAPPEKLVHWQVEPGTRIPRVPVDHPGGANTGGSRRRVRASLDVEATRVLCRDTARALGVRPFDLALTALAEAFARWTGERALLVDVIGHGRRAPLAGVNPSRTVGWFAISCPVLLDLGGTSGPVDAIQAVKQQFRSIPYWGFDYSVARYLREDVGASRFLPRPRVLFTYDGIRRPLESPLVGPAQESCGLAASPRLEWHHLLFFQVWIAGGRLNWSCVYSENVHRRATIDALLQGIVGALDQLVVYGRSVKEAE
jgi:non-ribosomal peptide synthase protein (TIGR01720 family)